MTRGPFSWRFARSLMVTCALVACGGEGIPAPTSVGPFDDDVCPAADGALGSATAQLDAGAFDPLRPHIETILVDGAGLKTTLNLASVVLPDLDDVVVTTLLAALTNDETASIIDAFKPHATNILEYLDGSSPLVPGPHPEPLAAAHAVVVNCDPVDNVRLVRDLLAVEVRRAPPSAEQSWIVTAAGEGEVSFVGALVDVIDRAQKIPAFRTLLDRVAIRADGEVPVDGEGGDIVVGRQAFIVIAKLLAANIAAPDFQLAPLRGLLEDVLVPQLEGDFAAEAALDELLDLMSILVDQQSQTFESVQAFMGCVDRHDSDAAVPAMLFDYLSADGLSVDALLADVAGASRKQQSADLRIAVVRLLDALIAHPAQLGDASGVVGAFLAPDVAPTLLSVLVSLKGTGVLTDLTGFVRQVIDCRGFNE